jgi:hypothetical protein
MKTKIILIVVGYVLIILGAGIIGHNIKVFQKSKQCETLNSIDTIKIIPYQEQEISPFKYVELARMYPNESFCQYLENDQKITNKEFQEINYKYARKLICGMNENEKQKFIQRLHDLNENR